MKRGEVVQLGRHRLMCGDATDAQDVAALMDGQTADMLFTDPPYGVGYKGGRLNRLRRRPLEGDIDASIYERFLPVAIRYVDGPCYLWFAMTLGESVYRALATSRCVISALIVWHKTNATYAALGSRYKQRHECCLFFKPRKSTLRWSGPTNERTVWDIKRDPVNRYHPTQKPVALAERAIGNHKAATVLDLFAGSGSTLIAADLLGRTCFAMEIDPDYCQVIVDRYHALTERCEVAS